MAVLSNFVLLIDRIAAPADITIPSNSLFRRVVQGYFLTISNPVSNNLAITFNLRFTINLTDVTALLDAADLLDVNNALFRGLIGTTVANSNHNLIVNREPDNISGPTAAIQPTILTVFSTGATSRTYTSIPINIGIGQTYSIALVPNTSNQVVMNTAKLAIRGYAELVSTPLLPFNDLIISAEHRGTFLDNSYPSVTNEPMDFDQIAYPLPMFSGGSKLTLAS
jgi:hypothetical protein